MRFGAHISKTPCQTLYPWVLVLARCFAYACTKSHPNLLKFGGDIAQIGAHQRLLSSINSVINSTPQGPWERKGQKTRVTPYTSLLLLSSRLLASITPPTGRKHPSKQLCPPVPSTSPPSHPSLSHPLRSPLRPPEPPLPMPHRCLLAQCSPPSTLTPMFQPNSFDSSSTALPSRFKPAPLNTPHRSPASRTSSPTS